MGFLFAQIFGAFALVFVSISYFLRDRYKFLLVQICVNFCYSAAFFIAGTYVGAAMMLTASFRYLYLFIFEKKSFKYTNYFLSVFIVIYIVLTIVFWVNWLDIMPLIASILFTVVFAIKNIAIGRPFFIVSCLLYVVYNIFAMTYISAASNLLEAIVVFCSIIKLCSNFGKGVQPSQTDEGKLCEYKEKD